MTQVVSLESIKEALRGADLVQLIAQGFVAYSQGKVVVPPVGEMIFDEPPGEAHLKYGFVRGDDHFVVKIATGFYRNPQLGLASSNGVVLVFSQKTGGLECVLLDEGHLTDVRTAVAGAVAARCLSPSRVQRIGIMGAGIQARLQLQHLRAATQCKDVLVWGRRQEALDEYAKAMAAQGFEVETTLHAPEVAASCRLIVTTTPSCVPLLSAEDIHPGTHITAMGSDTADKNELDPGILARADVVVVDSLAQSRSRGEVYQATKSGRLEKDDVTELGAALSDPSLGRTRDDQITVADLTGVAIQDIQIAKAVVERCGPPVRES